MRIDSTKNKIISVAHKLFTRFGFHKTSMDEIAKIARKAKGSIYYHFTSKEELFKEVVSKEISSLKDKLSVIMINPKLCASDKLRKYIITRMDILAESANYHEIIKADFFENLDFVDDLRTDLAEWERSNLMKIIQHGIEKGEFVVKIEINALLDALVLVIKGLETSLFLQKKYKESAPPFEGLLQLLTNGLQPK